MTKIDSVTKKKLQGAEFELKDALNAPVDLGRKLITDESGSHIDSLPAGEYSLVEIKAPTGYKLDSEPLKFTITKENKLI
ncbi:MAG: prealbumin-like fold domain-containing protein [Enterococcus sp.]|uniref:prealbumin-like fold domain-containing protein n=1 Tax=Enterococcus sp. TaxID=35783 RepID=UPI00399590E6